jgi:pSer/pThr/pTyr-binding forkhead associated (FHA) protein
MSELISTPESAGAEPLLDTLLREAVPEIKLALGDLIDRENQRAIPDRYHKLLPEQTLVVTLRPDAGEAVQPIAGELERELTDSCMRHGSLYDRAYRVKLRVAPSPAAPLFRVAMRRGEEAEPELFQVPQRRQPEPTPEVSVARPRVSVQVPSGPSTDTIAAGPAENATVVAPEPAAPAPPAKAAAVPSGPSIDPDATRLDGAPLAAAEAGAKGFDAGRFALVIEDEDGTERERFPVPAPTTTVGRQTDNLELRSDVAITDAPHVSRRQLVLVWEPREEQPGFTVYNVGLNPLHVGGREVVGANQKSELKVEELAESSREWVAPGSELTIGEHGPVLRIVDTRPADGAGAGAEGAPEVEIDPDATRFG